MVELVWTAGFRYTDRDSAPPGLQVFDMTKLLWKNEYDANAVDYAKPEEIANWYNNGSLEKVVWSSDEVKSLFVTSSPPKPTGVGEPADTPSSGHNGVVGAIAGGVFGGLVELVLICVGVW